MDISLELVKVIILILAINQLVLRWKIKNVEDQLKSDKEK